MITISVTFYWCTYIVIDSDIRDEEELLYNSDGTSDSGTFQCMCLLLMIIIIKDEPASSLQLGLFEDSSESNVIDAGDYCIYLLCYNETCLHVYSGRGGCT